MKIKKKIEKNTYSTKMSKTTCCDNNKNCKQPSYNPKFVHHCCLSCEAVGQGAGGREVEPQGDKREKYNKKYSLKMLKTTSFDNT